MNEEEVVGFELGDNKVVLSGFLRKEPRFRKINDDTENVWFLVAVPGGKYTFSYEVETFDDDIIALLKKTKTQHEIKVWGKVRTSSWKDKTTQEPRSRTFVEALKIQLQNDKEIGFELKGSYVKDTDKSITKEVLKEEGVDLNGDDLPF